MRPLTYQKATLSNFRCYCYKKDLPYFMTYFYLTLKGNVFDLRSNFKDFTRKLKLREQF